MVKKLITAVDYVVDEKLVRPVIYVFYRDENGKRIVKKVTNFEPYFYVLKDEQITSFKRIKRIEFTKFKTYDNKPLKKIITYLPKDVRDVREQFSKTYEADILFANRYIIDETDDSDWEYGKLRVLYMDIEVDDEVQFPNPNNPVNPVISISCYDNFTNKYYIFLWRDDLDESNFPFKGDVSNCESFISVKNFNVKEDEVNMDVKVNAFLFKDEIKMLNTFIEFVSDFDFDLIVGWNVIKFDLTYLFSRMKKLGIDFEKISPLHRAWVDVNYGDVKIYGRGVLDLLSTYRKISRGELKSYSLDYTAKTVLGYEKMKVERIKGSMLGRITNLWHNDLEKLVLYNLRDVFLCVELDKRLGLVSFMNELRKIVRANWDDLNYSSKLVDILLLRKAREYMVALPTKEKHKKETYSGAVVLEPKPGVHEIVFVSDFHSLYPSIIMTFNISPDTLNVGDKRIKLPNGVEFQNHEERVGLIPQLFSDLFKLRNKYKEERNKYPPSSQLYKLYDNKQFATKTIINSIYGVLGNSNFRFFSSSCASSITYMGRWLIKKAKEFFESDRGHEVVYGDTDSVFFKIKANSYEEAVEIGKRETEIFNKLIHGEIIERFGISSNFIKIELEPEKLFSRVIFTKAKKRYAGYICWKDGKFLSEPEFVTVGFEMKRSDTADITVDIQEHIFKLILEGKGKDDIIRYVRDEFRKIKEGKYPISYVAIPKTIRKDFRLYKANVPWVRGVLYSNQYLDMNFKPGDKVKLLFVKATGKYPPTDVLAFYDGWEMPKDFVVDWDRMIEHNLLNKISTLFSSFGWDFNPFFLLTNQKTLLE